MELVSIIIPVYNSSHYLKESIGSALSQSWPNVEVIIINDGSTDNSQEIIDEIKREYSYKIVAIQQTNSGAAAARNAGLRIAKGQYIQFLDSDDILPFRKIETQIKILQQQPDCVIGCKWIRFRESIYNTIGKEGPHNNIAKDLTPLEWLIEYHTMLLHAWLIPRKIIEKSGNWREDLSYNDDGEFMYRVVSHSRKVLFCHDTIVYYRTERINNLSNLSHNSREKVESLFKSVFSYMQTLMDIEDSTRTRQKSAFVLKKTYCEHYPLSRPFNNQVAKALKNLGGSNYKYLGDTPKEKFLIPLLGWKLVKIIKYTFTILNYKNI